jgi:hypothetical protein
VRTVQRQPIGDAPKDNRERQNDEANAERSHNKTFASAGHGDREQVVGRQTGVHYRDLAGKNTRERSSGAFYLRIVCPLYHREPRSGSRIICDSHLLLAVTQSLTQQTHQYNAEVNG